MSSTFPEIIENAQENMYLYSNSPQTKDVNEITQAVKTFSFQMVSSNSNTILSKYIFKI